MKKYDGDPGDEDRAGTEDRKGIYQTGEHCPEQKARNVQQVITDGALYGDDQHDLELCLYKALHGPGDSVPGFGHRSCEGELFQQKLNFHPVFGEEQHGDQVEEDTEAEGKYGRKHVSQAAGQRLGNPVQIFRKAVPVILTDGNQLKAWFMKQTVSTKGSADSQKNKNGQIGYGNGEKSQMKLSPDNIQKADGCPRKEKRQDHGQEELQDQIDCQQDCGFLHIEFGLWIHRSVTSGISICKSQRLYGR